MRPGTACECGVCLDAVVVSCGCGVRGEATGALPAGRGRDAGVGSAGAGVVCAVDGLAVGVLVAVGRVQLVDQPGAGEVAEGEVVVSDRTACFFHETRMWLTA